MRRTLTSSPTPGYMTIFCAWGVGNLIFKAFSRGFDLCLGVVGKIEPGLVGFKYFFLGAEVASSYKHVFARDGINLTEEI